MDVDDPEPLDDPKGCFPRNVTTNHMDVDDPALLGDPKVCMLISYFSYKILIISILKR